MLLLKSIHKVERKTWGEIYFPLGIAIMAWAFLPAHVRSYEMTVLIYGISDVLANLIGTYYGKHFYSVFSCKKSLEGSIAFFISIFIILLVFRTSLPMAALISLVTTLVEGLSPFGSDNLTIPIALSALLTFIRL
jgi:phytol kinase